MALILSENTFKLLSQSRKQLNSRAETSQSHKSQQIIQSIFLIFILPNYNLCHQLFERKNMEEVRKIRNPQLCSLYNRN